MCIFFGSEKGLIDIPAELLLISFSLQFQVKVHRNQDFLSISGSFLFNVDDMRCENELFVDGFIESCVSGSSGVKIIKPLGQCVLYFDIMSLDFSLKPK